MTPRQARAAPGNSAPLLDRLREREASIALTALLVACCVFSLTLVTSYFPITEGWFQDFSNYIDLGLVPYRDFYMFVPPGSIYLLHVVSTLSNDSILAMRLYGVAESMALIAAVFVIVRRLFAPQVALVAVLTGFVVSTANLQNVFYGYYQSSMLLSVLVLYLAIRCLEDERWRWPILFGLVSGVLVLFKQSTGVLLPFVLGLVALPHRRRIVASVPAYVTVVGVVGAVLAANSALQPALEQVIGSSSAKGGTFSLLFGFLGRPPDVPDGPLEDVRLARGWLVYLLFAAVALLCIVVRRESIRFLIAVAAFTLMWLHGMSGALEEHVMLLPGSLLIATALTARVSWPRARNLAVSGVSAVLVASVVVQRVATPYYWWGVNWLPSAWESSTGFADPHLVGLRGPPSYAADLDAIFRIVEAHKRPGDTMYTFPHLNYFNVMSGLPSPTFGKVDYFDVAPDSLAARDAARLREQPPTFIVWMELRPDVWAYHEKIFRGGEPSGQREIASAIDALVASSTYQSLGTFRVGASDPINIYVRQAP